MKNKFFSKGWFKDSIVFLIKESLWSNIPAISIIIWCMISYKFFPDNWGVLSLIGIIVIFVLFFIILYINEKKKSKKS
ncbi:hypothetical protein FE392_05860 [Xenorhabdus sp. 12]|uniref:Uncharacterized protein n=1 Tax=Xenorhabdus santafensis TaxID=2582833 RepID=A0ABU4S7U0_9GAMM|nr:hypothetical protein [Xenorhabdus sp. 12]MDX7986858.1 hypothetical protein [Xenorhabdus sp. 12]